MTWESVGKLVSLGKLEVCKPPSNYIAGPLSLENSEGSFDLKLDDLGSVTTY